MMKRKPLFGTWLLFEIGFFTVQTAVAFSQTTPSQAPAANALLAQLGTAFSGAIVVQHVQLNGNATWHAGSLNDSGTVTLTASSDGSWQMLLDLSGIGKKSESRTGAGLEATCQWSGSDGVLHPIAPGNCWKPATWFLPGLSLQSSIIPAYTATADLGNSTVGSGATFYRHLQGWIDYGLFSTAPPSDLAKQGIIDLGVDPVSLLPAVLSYSVRPDNGAARAIQMEIHYADYRPISGVRIPFHIQRFVNGSLQLDIVLDSAQIN